MSFRFHIQGKTLVLIDWANVFNWLRGKKWEIDKKALYDYLREYKNIDRICLFAGEDDHPKSKAFLEECRQIGFEVITKKVKYVHASVENSPFWKTLEEIVPSKKLDKIKETDILVRKCDFDVEISTELLLHLETYHSFILFSGDGDYAPIIEEIMKREKRVFIVATERSLGREIRDMMKKDVHPLLVDIFDLQGVIRRRKRNPNFRAKKSGFAARFFRLAFSEEIETVEFFTNRLFRYLISLWK
jgi:uncharacterized LabA/DUF88 family protein